MNKQHIKLTAEEVEVRPYSANEVSLELYNVEMEELADILIDNTTPDELFSYLNMNTLIDHLEMNGYSVMEGDK